MSPTPTDAATPPSWDRFPALPNSVITVAYWESFVWRVAEVVTNSYGHTDDSNTDKSNRDLFWRVSGLLPTGTPADWGFSDD